MTAPDIALPRVGISFRAAGSLCPGGLRDLLEYARMIERYGFDDFDAADHVVLGDDPEDYPGGEFRWGADSPWPDPFVLLSGVAAVTRRIHLTTSILVAPLRPAIVIAKMAATLDQLSGGRLRLGIGSGWNEQEFAAAGVPSRRRTARMEDYVGACRALWTQSPATFSSETVSFEGLWCRPGALRAEGIPVLLGGPAHPRTAARIARIGDGWNPMNSQRESISTGVALLGRAFEDAGRDPGSALIRVPVPEAVAVAAVQRRDAGILRRELESLSEAGVTDTKLYLSGLVNRPDEVEHVVAWLSDALELPTA